MSDGDALYRAILANPADDAPRLVYADWLDDHGDPERAEFIRLQIGPGDHLGKGVIREAELLERRWRDWFGPALARAGFDVPAYRVLKSVTGAGHTGGRLCRPECSDDGAELFGSATVCRGFLEEFVFIGDADGDLDGVLAGAPVRELALVRWRTDSLARAVRAGRFRNVKALALQGCPPETVRQMNADPDQIGVTRLEVFDGVGWEGSAFPALLAGAWLERVEEAELNLEFTDRRPIPEIDALIARPWAALRGLRVVLHFMHGGSFPGARLRRLFENRFGGVLKQFEAMRGY